MAKVTLTVDLSRDELTDGAVALARGLAARVADADAIAKATVAPANFTPTGGTFVFDLSPAPGAPAAPAPAAAAK